MAGVGAEDIQFAELHDCFTIAEIIASEDLGLLQAGRGRAVRVRRAARCATGPRPINTSGGLKAKGHPVGATGVAQICDLMLQIRGEAGERQIPRTRDRAGREPRRLRRDLRRHDPGGGMRRTGTVYTETVIYSAPEAFANEAPYQTAIVTLDGGGRVTGRILGDRVAIDDRVVEVEDAQRRPLFHESVDSMKLAERMSRIGVESAFDVLVKARALEAQGQQRGAPGDRRARFPYAARTSSKRPSRRSTAAGRIMARRRACPSCARRSRRTCRATRGIEVGPEHVSVVPGGKPIIFFPMLALLEPGDEVIYPESRASRSTNR